jgi:hypothetical protein
LWAASVITGGASIMLQCHSMFFIEAVRSDCPSHPNFVLRPANGRTMSIEFAERCFV